MTLTLAQLNEALDMRDRLAASINSLGGHDAISQPASIRAAERLIRREFVDPEKLAPPVVEPDDLLDE